MSWVSDSSFNLFKYILSTNLPSFSYISQASLFISLSTAFISTLPARSPFIILNDKNLLTGVPIKSRPPIIPALCTISPHTSVLPSMFSKLIFTFSTLDIIKSLNFLSYTGFSLVPFVSANCMSAYCFIKGSNSSA